MVQKYLLSLFFLLLLVHPISSEQQQDNDEQQQDMGNGTLLIIIRSNISLRSQGLCNAFSYLQIVSGHAYLICALLILLTTLVTVVMSHCNINAILNPETHKHYTHKSKLSY